MKVRVKSGEEIDVTVEVEADATVVELKYALSPLAGIEVERMRLLFKGRVLKDELSLSSYDIVDGSKVLLVVREAAATSEPAPQPSRVPVPDAKSNNFMASMLNSPMMEGLLSNPEFMRDMMMSNPQMRQIVERNPEIGHALNNPEVLRQSLEIARNPELMREMQRNADRAMNNVSAHPGGFNFNALRRMYTDVNAPLMEATAAAASGRTPTRPSRSSLPTSSTPNSEPLPNPWRTPPQQPWMQPQQQQPWMMPQPWMQPQQQQPWMMMQQLPPPPPPPEQQYASQLADLNELGFTDQEANLRALVQAKGDIDAALDLVVSELEAVQEDDDDDGVDEPEEEEDEDTENAAKE